MKRAALIVAAAWAAASAAIVAAGWWHVLERLEAWRYRRAVRRLDVHGWPVELCEVER